MGYKIYGNYEFKETEFTVEEMLKMVNKLKTAVITDYEKKIIRFIMLNTIMNFILLMKNSIKYFLL